MLTVATKKWETLILTVGYSTANSLAANGLADQIVIKARISLMIEPEVTSLEDSMTLALLIMLFTTS